MTKILIFPQAIEHVLPNTPPPQTDDDWQNLFLAGILTPMRDVILQFSCKKLNPKNPLTGEPLCLRVSPVPGGSPCLRT
jgi:hypothetical protein